MKTSKSIYNKIFSLYIFYSGNESLQAWGLVFFISAAVMVGGNLLYLGLYRAEEQPWNHQPGNFIVEEKTADKIIEKWTFLEKAKYVVDANLFRLGFTNPKKISSPWLIFNMGEQLIGWSKLLRGHLSGGLIYRGFIVRMAFVRELFVGRLLT